MTIVLDSIRSGWNVGSIFRTCDALGADLILIGYTPKPIGSTLPIIHKTAINAENFVKWQSFDHFQEVFDMYPKSLHLAIEISQNSQDLLNFIKDKKSLIKKESIFLWFGNEIHGLQSDLINQTNYQLHLPMEGKKESLNVANCVCAVGYLFKSVDI